MPGGGGGGGGSGIGLGDIATAAACALAGLPVGCSTSEIIHKGLTSAFPKRGGGQTARSCEPPTVYDPELDTCIFEGSPGEVSVPDVTDTGQPDVGMGMFGLLSTSPIIVGEVNGNPIRRCPHPGLVLGKDNRCYAKGGSMGITNRQRKWPKRKCMSRTEKDMKAISNASKAAKRLKKKFKGTGFKVVKTGR